MHPAARREIEFEDADINDEAATQKNAAPRAEGVPHTVDVFVAGGGPAGLAAAIAAAQRGFSVEVADGMIPPIDKACGEGLLPDTIDALARLGIDLRQAESAPLRGIRFLAAGSQSGLAAQATFPAEPGKGMRRPILHQLLIDRATALGVRLNWQTSVQSLDPKQGSETSSSRTLIRTNRHEIRARFVVGADGHQSRVRTWAGIDRASTSTRRTGLRQHFALAPWADFVEVYWSDRGQAYVTPISPHSVCVAFVAHQKFQSVEQALTHFPELAQRLGTALPSNSPRGSITLSRKLDRVTCGNVALVGDASGSVDAVTGEGLGLCFRQALALGKALQAGDLNVYQHAHQALFRLPYFMARAMLLLDRSTTLRSLTLKTLQYAPELFNKLIAIHIGHGLTPSTDINLSEPPTRLQQTNDELLPHLLH